MEMMNAYHLFPPMQRRFGRPLSKKTVPICCVTTVEDHENVAGKGVKSLVNLVVIDALRLTRSSGVFRKKGINTELFVPKQPVRTGRAGKQHTIRVTAGTWGYPFESHGRSNGIQRGDSSLCCLHVC